MSNPVVKFLINPMSSMVLMLGLVQVVYSKKARLIDLNDPQVVMTLRFAYGASQILSLLFCLWLRAKINKIGDKKHFVEVEEPPKPFSEEERKKTKMSVIEYDLAEVGKQIQQILVSAGLLLAIHSYFGYTQPLFLQSILPWKNLLTLPIVRIHLWGCEATGDLARPFKAPNPLGDLVNAATETNAVENGAAENDAVESTATEKKDEQPAKGKKSKKND